MSPNPSSDLSPCQSPGPCPGRIQTRMHGAFSATAEHLVQSAISKQPQPKAVQSAHRHIIDKYLDTLLINQPISDDEAADHWQKVTSQDGGLPELIVARSCLTNHSEASRP